MTATQGSAPVRAASASALAAPLACGCCLLAGAAYVAANDPSDGGLFLPCPFRTLTGWWCPGCGLTRATHHLLRGDVVQALRFNAFVFVVLGAIATAWLAWLAAAAGRPSTWLRRVSPWMLVAAYVAFLGFAVVRNLPSMPFLRG